MKDKRVIKYLIGLFKTHKKELVIIMTIAALGSLMTVAVPYIYGRLFDLALIPKTTTTLLLSLIGLWAVLTLISNYISARTTALGDTLGARVSLESEVDAYGHFLTLPASFHKDKKKGSILDKIARGSWNLSNFIEIFAGLLPSLLFLVFALITMLFIQWQLGIIIIVTFIIYSIITLKLTKDINKSQENLQKVFEKTYGTVYDSLYNPFLVKNFTMEEKQKKKISDLLVTRVIPYYKESADKSARLQHLQGIIYNLSFIVVLGLAILFLRQGEITQGEFIMFFGYINLSFGPFFRLSAFYNQYKKAAVGIKRIIELKNMAPEQMKHGEETIKNYTGKISLKNISFSYAKSKEILKNISLNILPGENVAIVGESGVGKSTLSELILNYYQPSKGKIYFDDIEVSRLKLKWIREQIAVVPQEISVFNDTILNNIKFANPSANFEDIVKAAKAANAHDFIMKTTKKYETLVGERGVKLSVGQKQRIAIAMAFLKNPKILIMDEPTSSLDAKSESKVQEGIKNLINGRTTIIIAHRFSTVKNADKIVVLDKGKIIEMGNHTQLMKIKGKYYELYNLQKGLY